MSNLSPLFESVRTDWPTPSKLYRFLCQQLHLPKPLDLDVCATAENAKCNEFFSPETDGLSQSWAGRRCWMNPPYGKEIVKWVSKASEGEAHTVVGLLPARTDTRWWHTHVMNKAHTIFFIRGRIKFEGANNAAPFPSVIILWLREFHTYKTPIIGSLDACEY